MQQINILVDFSYSAQKPAVSVLQVLEDDSVESILCRSLPLFRREKEWPDHKDENLVLSAEALIWRAQKRGTKQRARELLIPYGIDVSKLLQHDPEELTKFKAIKSSEFTTENIADLLDATALFPEQSAGIFSAFCIWVGLAGKTSVKMDLPEDGAFHVVGYFREYWTYKNKLEVAKGSCIVVYRDKDDDDVVYHVGLGHKDYGDYGIGYSAFETFRGEDAFESALNYAKEYLRTAKIRHFIKAQNQFVLEQDCGMAAKDLTFRGLCETYAKEHTEYEPVYLYDAIDQIIHKTGS